jgi:hypothetical protein
VAAPSAVPTQRTQQVIFEEPVVEVEPQAPVPAVPEPMAPTSAPQTQEPIPPPPVPTQPPTPTPQPNYAILVFVGIMGTLMVTASIFGYSQFKKRHVQFDIESTSSSLSELSRGIEDMPCLTPVYEMDSRGSLASVGSMDRLIPASPVSPDLSKLVEHPMQDRVSWIQPPCQSFRLSDLQTPIRMASVETLKE